MAYNYRINEMRINTVFGSISETKTIKKQNMTAVEWLLNEINKLTGLTINPDEPIVEQAKQMEKQQIIEAYKRESAFMKHVGCTDDMIDKSSIKYYNETYGK